MPTQRMDRTNPSIAYCFNLNCPPLSQPLASHCQRCGASLQLHGYRAIALLGHNQFSRTWRAIDEMNLDCMIQAGWSDPTQTRLSQALQAIAHAKIPKLIETFEQDNAFYWVQEWIQGESLAQAIATQGTFSSAKVWQVLEELLPVLQQIHAHQIIHADIKPQNIIERDRSLVLVDFKSAIFSGDRLGKPQGNPEYAAPEQIKGEAVFASDLYSLGMVGIHLLTGISPFQLFDTVGNWRDYWIEPAAAIDSTNRLASVLDRLTAPSLSNRFASAADAIVAIERLRGKKIPIPLELPAIELPTTTFSGHEGLFASVTAVAIAPDNQHIASASEDKTVRLWRVDGRPVEVLKGHTQFVQGIAFHPHQPELLISGGRDRSIKLWNWPEQKEMWSIAAHSQGVNAIAFSPTGAQFASGSADKTVKLWSIEGELMTTFAPHRLAVNAVAFAPLAPLIASASADAIVRLWDWKTAKLIWTLSGHLQAVRAIAFSPDGQILASGGEDKTIRLWDIASGQCVRVLPGHSWSVSALVFALNHTLISGSWDKTVKVWQVETGEMIAQLSGHSDSVTSIAISTKQNSSLNQRFFISGSRDRTLKQWPFDRDDET